MNKTLIIGAGQIGKALYEVLSPYYDTAIVDKHEKPITKDVDIMHICFPYSKNFVKEVKRYQKLYKPKITVIHSTVPVGTSRKCNACHSPVRGMHPYLAESIRTFVKFVGGKKADLVAEYFRRANIKAYICRKSETTELGKLLSTTYYAVCIEYVKSAEKLCEKYKVPFSEAFTLFNLTYNEGWTKLGHPEYQRPTLVPIQRKQGGHCTLPNCDLLESKFTKLIKELNEKQDEIQ